MASHLQEKYYSLVRQISQKQGETYFFLFGTKILTPKYHMYIMTHLILSVFRATVEGIVCLVVHDQLVVNKVEAVRPGLVRVLNHQVPGVLVHRGKLVDMLAGVLTAGDAEAEVKVEGLEVGVAEIMALDHTEILHRSNVF